MISTGMLLFLLVAIVSNTLTNFYDSKPEITWFWTDFKNCLKSVRKMLFVKSSIRSFIPCLSIKYIN